MVKLVHQNFIIMKVKSVFAFLLFFYVAGFVNGQNVSHNIEVYMGYSTRSDMRGSEMQCQYAMGVCPHLDLLACVSYVNVLDFGCDRNHQSSPFMSFSNTFSIGARGILPVCNRFYFKLSCLAGISADCGAVVNTLFSCPEAMWRGALDGKAEVNVLLGSRSQVGLFYDYSMFSEVDDMQTIGVCASFKL